MRGEQNYYLSKQRLHASNVRIEVDFVGVFLGIHLSPVEDSGWVVKNPDGKFVAGKRVGQTALVGHKRKNAWIRDGVFTKTIHFKEMGMELTGDKKNTLVVVIKDDNKASYSLGNSELVTTSLAGSGLSNQGYFHFGLWSFGDDTDTWDSLVTAIRITKLASTD